MGYEEGFNHGYHDGKDGKPATGKPPLGKSLLSSQRYLDQYLLGYQFGYRRAREKRLERDQRTLER